MKSSNLYSRNFCSLLRVSFACHCAWSCTQIVVVLNVCVRRYAISAFFAGDVVLLVMMATCGGAETFTLVEFTTITHVWVLRGYM